MFCILTRITFIVLKLGGVHICRLGDFEMTLWNPDTHTVVVIIGTDGHSDVRYCQEIETDRLTVDTSTVQHTTLKAEIRLIIKVKVGAHDSERLGI